MLLFHFYLHTCNIFGLALVIYFIYLFLSFEMMPLKNKCFNNPTKCQNYHTIHLIRNRLSPNEDACFMGLIAY